MGVYAKVPKQECWEQTDKDPIAVRWIDINKGDAENPNYRSRLVAKEFKTDVNTELYAATPPSECFRMLIGRMASQEGSEMMYADVSWAYFYVQAVRQAEVYEGTLQLEAALFSFPGATVQEKAAWLEQRPVFEVRALLTHLDRNVLSYRERVDFF